MALGQEVASFYATIGVDSKDFKKGLGDAKDGMSNLEKTSQALGTAFKATFAVGATAVAGFTAVIAKSVSAAADMEQGVTDIGAVMGLTAQETQQLGQHIMDLGLDPNLKVSATEASEAIMALGTAGLSMEQIMGGASKATVLLANATGADFGNAASIATDVMGQFNIKAEDMNAAVNQITGATVASKFSINDMALAYSQAGGVAGSVGVNFEDFNAAIAAISPSFASGSDAGTSFKTLLQRMVPSTEDAKIALKDLGLMAADGSAKFFDASGNMKSMEEIAGLLHDAFTGLSDAQKIETASTLFGTDAMRAGLALAEAGTPVIQKMKAAIGNVDAEEMAAKRMDTFKGSLEIAQGVIETMTIGIGQKFLPVLQPLIERFTELATKYGPAVVGFFGNLADKMALGIQKGTDWATNVLPSLWQWMTTIGEVLGNLTHIIVRSLKPVTDTIGKWLDWKDVLAAVGVLLIGPVAGAIGTAIAAVVSFIAAFSPVLITLAAVTAAIVALKVAWKNNFLGIQDITQEALMFIGDWLREKTNLWKGDWTKTLNYILNHSEDVWRDISESVKHYVFSFINETRAKIEWWVGEVWRFFDIYFSKTGIIASHILVWKNHVIHEFKEWSEKVIDFFRPVLDWWGDHIQPMIDAGRDIIRGLWDGMRQVWSDFMQWWNHVWGKDLTKTVQVKMETHSPSKVMERLGANVVEGFAIGADSMMPAVYDVMGGLSNASISAGSSSQPANSNARVEELLAQLINVLQNKNMTVNVAAAGGSGMDYGAQTNFMAQGRR